MKAEGRSRSAAPLILNPDTRWGKWLALNLMFVVPYILVTYVLLNSNWMYYMLYFFLEEVLALHVSDAIYTHHQEHNCNVQPQVFMVLVCFIP
jgi:hypothetical protein